MKADFNKTKEILKNAINKSNEQISDNERKYQLILANQFEVKSWSTIVFSILPCFFFTFLAESLIMSGAFPLFLGANANYFSLTIAISALLTGNVVRKLIERKTDTKSKFKKFSTARSNSEKIEDEIKYAIELEKAKNRKETFFQIAKSLKNNYFNNLSTELMTEYNKLDILTTQKILSEKCWNIRTKGMLICNFMLFSLCGGFLTFLYCTLPLIIASKNIAFSSISLFPTLAPLVGGFLGGCTYLIKRNKDYTNMARTRCNKKVRVSINR